MKITSEIHVDLPEMPNYLKVRFGCSAEDAYDSVVVDIATLTHDGVDEYLAEYAVAFRDHWEKRKGVVE